MAPPGERPPLVVMSHGGPTSQANTSLSLLRQVFTSRGIAVVDVDYGGSTGYGRAFRDELHERWGIVDVDDCANAALFLVEEGLADPDRLAIRGGSAGGYTTLAALCFRDVFLRVRRITASATSRASLPSRTSSSHATTPG